MSSEFYTPGGIGSTRSNMLPINKTTQMPFRSPLAGISPDPVTQLLHRRPNLIGGKRSLAEFQQQQHQQLQLQQQHNLGIYLRNVKQRMYQQASSPISPLSPMNLSHVSSLSPELSSVSSLSNSSSDMNPRYGLPILQQSSTLPTLNPNMFNNMLANYTNNNNINNNNFVVKESTPSNVSFQNSVQNHNLSIPTSSSSLPVQESETKMMNRLQELEKELLDDNDDEGQGANEVSGVINSEWSETYQKNLMVNQTSQQQPISLSPTSSSSSCSSTSASPTQTSPKQLISDAASAISEGKSNDAAEFLTRLSNMANVNGTPEQRLTAYIVSALRPRVNSTQYPVPVSEIFSQEHTLSTHKLYDISPCFKLGFMAANMAIIEATTMEDQLCNKLHVIDFDIGQGGQYAHLLHALAAKKHNKLSFLKITTFTDYFSRGEEARLKVVGDTLKALASKIGISLDFNVMNMKMNDLSREKLGLEDDEALAVNLAFKLYKLPDESVTTENLRDEILRRVKRLSPNVVTVVEQDMNCNTAPFAARVNEVFGYYNALFESLESVSPRECPDRVRIESGLGRKIANAIACEGSDRIERCEVFGKWRARIGMAGFGARPMSQLVVDSLRSKLGAMTRGNRGFTVNEQSGGICFGWMGRSLTVASAWH
ncbi:hypothetical protein LIER_27415 [Lithospermum erythrorhizon]|uniref:Scarecrow-like protein 8 n=1 Tax=Lithospermum erythrorhizon TaxID=34254 RepID=A0AAV3NZ19_LITER